MPRPPNGDTHAPQHAVLHTSSECRKRPSRAGAAFFFVCFGARGPQKKCVPFSGAGPFPRALWPRRPARWRAARECPCVPKGCGAPSAMEKRNRQGAARSKPPLFQAAMYPAGFLQPRGRPPGRGANRGLSGAAPEGAACLRRGWRAKVFLRGRARAARPSPFGAAGKRGGRRPTHKPAAARAGFSKPGKCGILDSGRKFVTIPCNSAGVF